jgi:hypothetical protein
VLVSIQHDASPGAVMVTSFAVNEETGFSTNFPFIDRATLVSTKLAGAHVRIGMPSPAEGFPSGTRFSAPLILANAGAQQTQATVCLDYTVNSIPHRIQVGIANLDPGQVSQFELSQALVARGIQGPLDDTGVDISYTGPPGTVLGRLTSSDQSGDFAFDVPVKDPLAGMGRAEGSYPWRLDDGYTTVVHLKNTVNAPVRAIMQVRYAGGNYNPERITLEPFQTLAIDIRALRDRQQKDIRGNLMPPDVESGQVIWYEQTLGSLIGRAEVANVAGGVASSFSCGGSNCPASFHSVSMSPSSTVSSYGDSPSKLFTPQETDEDCQFVSYGPFNVTTGVTWSSTNMSVATVGSDGTVTSVGVGTASILAGWTATIYECGNACMTTTANPQATGNLTVKPTVQISFSGSGVPLSNGTPPQGSPAFVNSVTMTATGNPSGGTYSWSTTSSKVTLSNTSTATVTVTAASASSSQNDVPVKVTYTLNSQSGNATQNTTVQKPTSMGFITVVSDAANSCSSGQAGWKKVIQWQVQDQLSPANAIQFALPTYDTLTAVQGQNGCNLTLSGTAPGSSTGSTGIWEHTYKFCTTLCSCETDSTQAFFVNGFEIDLSVAMRCNGITVAGH